MPRTRLTGRDVDDVLAGRRPDARADVADLVDLVAVLHASRELEPPPPLSAELRHQIERGRDVVDPFGGHDLGGPVGAALPPGVEAIRPARPACYRRPVASVGMAAAALLVGVVLATAGDDPPAGESDTVSDIDSAGEGGPLDDADGDPPAPTTAEPHDGATTTVTADAGEVPGAGGTAGTTPDAGSGDGAPPGAEDGPFPGDGDGSRHGGDHRDGHRDGGGWWDRRHGSDGDRRDGDGRGDGWDGRWYGGDGFHDGRRGDGGGRDRTWGAGPDGDRSGDGGGHDGRDGGELAPGDAGTSTTTGTTPTTSGTTTTGAAVEPRGDVAVTDTTIGHGGRSAKQGTTATTTRYSAQHSTERNRHPADGWGWFPRRLTPGGRAGPFGG